MLDEIRFKMTDDTYYNGYKNYETLTVAHWLASEEESRRHWREVAREQKREAPHYWEVREEIWAKADAAKYRLARMLRAEVEKGSPLEGESSLYSDLLSAALSEVDWYEVAQEFLEE